MQEAKAEALSVKARLSDIGRPVTKEKGAGRGARTPVMPALESRDSGFPEQAGQ